MSRHRRQPTIAREFRSLDGLLAFGDPLMDRCVSRRLDRCGDLRADRIEVDVGGTRKDCCIIEQSLGSKSSLPESAGTAVFFVRPSGDRFAQASHEPAHARQPCATQLDDLSILRFHGDDGFESFSFLLRFRRRTEDQPPASGDVFSRPAFCNIRPLPENHVQVVIHDRKARDVDRERTREPFECLTHPIFAM